ncbi:hypothetical protein DB32_001946 [Sandaracinus amylolyticus]|uniref:Uncharacterized protein n=1 Tax=Sandaracinus amylolyticus TaxID=927083 RepID=A0A0F6YGJ9_9BACT|nr:hypothetical protein DB32_001946 [Sandaracinus amylolyticus]
MHAPSQGKCRNGTSRIPRIAARGNRTRSAPVGSGATGRSRIHPPG